MQTTFSYGFCPYCKAPGVAAERSPYGMTFCKNGHKYSHASRVYDDPQASDEPTTDMGV